MKLKDFYSTYLANLISAGGLATRSKLSATAIKPAFNKILTQKSITYSWIVGEVPTNLSFNLTLVIRKSMKERFPTIKTIVSRHTKRVIVPVQSNVFKRRLSAAVNLYEDFKQVYEEKLNTSERALGKVFRFGSRTIAVNKDVIAKHKAKADSFLYVNNAKRNGAGFYETYYVIQAHGEDLDELNRYNEALTEMLEGMGVTSYFIYGDISNFLKNFGPATAPVGDLKKFPSMLMSDENLSMITPTKTRGLFSSGTGVPFGMDIYSYLPAFVNLFRSSAAQVFLVSAIAGYGKSALIFMILLYLLTDEVHINVVDMKGDEYRKLFPFMSSRIEIDMDTDTWVNTMRIDDLGIKDYDGGEAYKMAIASTVSIFKEATSITEKEGSAYDVESFLNFAVTKCYDTLSGFDVKDPDTYDLTKKLTFSMVIDNLRGLAEGKYNDDQRKTLDLLIQRSMNEFKSEHLPADKEITLSQVLKVSYVVYSFNKSKSVGSRKRENVKVLMCSSLNKKKHYYRRKERKHTIEIYEEVQITDQVGDAGQLVKLIKDDVTIGRSDNVSVFLITNALSVLNDPEMKSVKSNLTGLIIGKISKDDQEILKTMNGGNDIIDDVEVISSNGGSKLKHCFAIRYDDGFESDNTVIKAIIPPEIEERIRQRDTMED